MEQSRNLTQLQKSISACRICIEKPYKTPLPHEPRPVLQVSRTARLCICGQAPGTKVHASGRPFTDPSGVRLRDWLGIDEDVFYDQSRVAIVPMGFCFPGQDARGGDLPPRKECEDTWQQAVFDQMPQLELILLVGQYAQAFHLGDKRKKNLTHTVMAWREYLGDGDCSNGSAMMPLPHPSWRNNGWIRKNLWFSEELLPILKSQVSRLVG
ncbi:MAG: uracil-DNA glycosylase [Hyphomicrobiales bacterium]|nr:uracil-DNA glycosylase family protein [Hyphomicrobiales bacterium]PCJ95813.1 MAG: uracil-DNA glycosylase [Hyphomicrobiales bacterium]